MVFCIHPKKKLLLSVSVSVADSADLRRVRGRGERRLATTHLRSFKGVEFRVLGV